MQNFLGISNNANRSIIANNFFFAFLCVFVLIFMFTLLRVICKSTFFSEAATSSHTCELDRLNDDFTPRCRNILFILHCSLCDFETLFD